MYRAVLGDSLQHGSGLENEGREYDPTEVSPRSQLGDDVGEHWRSIACQYPVDMQQMIGSRLTVSLVGLNRLLIAAEGVGLGGFIERRAVA